MGANFFILYKIRRTESRVCVEGKALSYGVMYLTLDDDVTRKTIRNSHRPVKLYQLYG